VARPSSAPRAVLFDWDGTLWDSAEACYRSYDRLFRSYGIPFDRTRYEETYAPDWRQSYRALGLAEHLWEEADARWMQEYALEERRLVAGASEALARLTARGVILGLVTSGSRDRVHRELEELGIRDAFAAVVCAEDVRRRKPDPEGLLEALRRLDVSPPESAYVGDSPEDVSMARAAGVRSVGIPGGFPNREALAAARPDLLMASLEDAVRALVC
jgi:HAD superfamily hydrolase (TIGR01549 family)